MQIRTLIDNAIVQTMDGRGIHIHVGGDYFDVGDINDVRGMAIGGNASGASTS